MFDIKKKCDSVQQMRKYLEMPQQRQKEFFRMFNVCLACLLTQGGLDRR